MGEHVDRLRSLAESNLDSADTDLIVAFSAVYTSQHGEMVALSKGLLERAPGRKDNWVERAGSLPAYVEKIANSLHTKRGMTISRAIATAISRIKVWALGGDGVDPDTVAKAQKALAQWTALKAKNKAKQAVK